MRLNLRLGFGGCLGGSSPFNPLNAVYMNWQGVDMTWQDSNMTWGG